MAEPKKSKLKTVGLFFWDPQSKKCMGRTGMSWLKLIAFYIALYVILAAVWSSFFLLFQQTISDRKPKWLLDDSLIGTNPGLGFRPQNPPDRIDSALISYRLGPKSDYQHWINDLSNYIELSKRRDASHKVDCSSERDVDAYCPFDSSIIPPECTAAQNFSFSIGRPCILIKLNRIYGWKPVPFEKKPSNYPKDAPFTPNAIQITCDGQNDFDKEHVGPREYHPLIIETKYYPFTNQPGYQSPFVMVQFKEPKYNTLIYVECKAWAKNIEHDRINRRGSTSFELFIEKPAEGYAD